MIHETPRPKKPQEPQEPRKPQQPQKPPGWPLGEKVPSPHPTPYPKDNNWPMSLPGGFNGR